MILTTAALFTIQSCAIALSNSINGSKSRSQAREFKQFDIEAEQRKTKENRENEILRHERSLELEIFKSNLQSSEKQRIMNLDKYGVSFTNGNFLKSVVPFSTSPTILFDTVLSHSTTKKDDNFIFNPMESLYHSFKKRNQKFPSTCNILSIKAGFSSEVEVLGFYNNELRNVPAVIIYGNYDGNHLRINASFGGMNEDDFFMGKDGILKIREQNADFMLLSEIKLSLIHEAINSQLEKDAQIARENLQMIIDIISNTSLQGLIDSYYSLFHPTYKPFISDGIKLLNDLKAESNIVSHSFTDTIPELIDVVVKFEKHIINQRDRIHRKKTRYNAKI